MSNYNPFDHRVSFEDYWRNLTPEQRRAREQMFEKIKKASRPAAVIFLLEIKEQLEQANRHFDQAEYYLQLKRQKYKEYGQQQNEIGKNIVLDVIASIDAAVEASEMPQLVPQGAQDQSEQIQGVLTPTKPTD